MCSCLFLKNMNSLPILSDNIRLYMKFCFLMTHDCSNTIGVRKNSKAEARASIGYVPVKIGWEQQVLTWYGCPLHGE